MYILKTSTKAKNSQKMPHLQGIKLLSSLNNVFVIGSSNAKLLFKEYADKFFKISNPKHSLQPHMQKEIQEFLDGIHEDSIILFHFLINGLYSQWSACDNVGISLSCFKERAEELVAAVSNISAIVRRVLGAQELKFNLLIVPMLPRYL